jgi:drug/metabolite transporter (DMT)-like permease
MDRTNMLKYINPVIAILIVSQLLSALSNDILPDEVFEAWHKGGGILLLIGVLLHLFLNWGWVKSTYFKN